MAKIKSWNTRVPLIIQHLETDGKPVYTRAEVEVLFGIGRSRATALMKTAGATVRNGAETTVSRDNLRYYVERCPEAQRHLAEIDRREKLARKLRQTTEELRQKDVPIAGAKPQDEWIRWVDLPNVDIGPGMMRITFGDSRELLHALWLVSRALANEPELFEKMCGPAAAGVEDASDHRKTIPAAIEEENSHGNANNAALAV